MSLFRWAELSVVRLRFQFCALKKKLSRTGYYMNYACIFRLDCIQYHFTQEAKITTGRPTKINSGVLLTRP